MMKLLVVVCALALAANQAQAQDPASFRVLDKINGILEKEINMLDGGSTQVGLRGTSQNFMRIGGDKWTSFKKDAAKRYDAMTAAKDVKMDDLKAEFDSAISSGKANAAKGFVWAESKIRANPYKWMAFKVGVSVVTVFLCPACVALITAIKATFAVIATVQAAMDLVDTAATLPEGLSDEAKAACKATASIKFLLIVANEGVNVFTPFPFLDAGAGVAAGASELFGTVDWSKLIDKSVADSAVEGLKAVGTFIKDAVTGAIGEKVNESDPVAKKLEYVKNKFGKIIAKLGDNGRMAKLSCEVLESQFKDEEVPTGDDDKDSPGNMQDGGGTQEGDAQK